MSRVLLVLLAITAHSSGFLLANRQTKYGPLRRATAASSSDIDSDSARPRRGGAEMEARVASRRATVEGQRRETVAGKTSPPPAKETPAPHDVVVVSHAAGRMGKLVVAQLRETWRAADQPLTVRALVRNSDEARSFTADIAGLVLINGKAIPRELEDIEVVVVEFPTGDALSPTPEAHDALRKSFVGATLAVLCDSAHAEMTDCDDGSGCVLVEGAAEQSHSTVRLLAEIDAARLAAPDLRHVVLRSTMGLACAASGDASAASACERMGGTAATNKMETCERALREVGLPHTIVRFGALTDDAGMIPLEFAHNDALLLAKEADGDADERSREPPLISRADAARLAVELVRPGAPAARNEVVDAAWDRRFGRQSVGLEEAQRAAARQKLVPALFAALESGTYELPELPSYQQ